MANGLVFIGLYTPIYLKLCYILLYTLRLIIYFYILLSINCWLVQIKNARFRYALYLLKNDIQVELADIVMAGITRGYYLYHPVRSTLAASVDYFIRITDHGYVRLSEHYTFYTKEIQGVGL